MCAEFTKRHRNCKILPIFSAVLLLVSYFSTSHSRHKAFWSKRNKIKKHQKKFFKRIEMQNVQNPSDADADYVIKISTAVAATEI